MTVNACGSSGGIEDPEHRKICLACNGAWWREQHPKLTIATIMVYVIAVFVALMVIVLSL